MHWGVYDPAEAHDYYLRTRQLKGRAPGAMPPPGTKIPPGAVKKAQKKPIAKGKVFHEPHSKLYLKRLPLLKHTRFRFA